MNLFKIFKRHYPMAPSRPIHLGSEEINPFRDKDPILKEHRYSLKMGSQLSFIGKVHVSVGYWFEQELDEKYFDLKCLGQSDPNCGCGGDDYMKTFVFTPKKRGNTRIVIKHNFRGGIIKTEIVNIQIV